MQDNTGVPTGAAQCVYSADEGLPRNYHFDQQWYERTVYHFDNTDTAGANEDGANPNTTKKSRWGPPLKSKRKDGADTKIAAKKAAKKEGKKKFRCVICNKDFKCTNGLKQHKSKNKKHKKRLARLEKQQRNSDNQFPHKSNDEISPSMSSEQQHQKKSDSDVSYYGRHAGTANWDETVQDEQVYDTNNHDRIVEDRIAEANRQWIEVQNSAPYTTGLQPDDCPSMNQSFQSDENQTQANAEHHANGYDESEVIQSDAIQTQSNLEHYDQGNVESDVKIGEGNDGNSNNNHSSDFSKISGNLMKLTAGQSLQTRYPKGCQVIYSYETDSNDSDETRVRIGKIQDVYIDMKSSSRQLAYEINPNMSDTLVLIEEHLLAFAPQCPILFHKTPRELSALAREEVQALEGIVLATQWINTNPFGSDLKLSYTILLQHSTTDEHILKTNVSGENISYRPTNI